MAQLCQTICDPMDCIHGILQARILEWIAFPFSRDLPNAGIKPRSPALRADSLPTEPQGKPKNTGVGSLSFLQRIFPTRESNHGLLHCRQIFYQLNYKRTPSLCEWLCEWLAFKTISNMFDFQVYCFFLLYHPFYHYSLLMTKTTQ